LATADSANQFDWLNEDFDAVAAGTAVDAFAIAVPQGSVDVALMRNHGARSLINVTPATKWVTSFEDEVSSLPVGAMPRLGFYADNGDGRNWTIPDVPSTLYLVAPAAGSYRLLIEVDDLTSALQDCQVAIVAGRSPISYRPVSKSIELSIEVLADEIIPVTFILPTWGYQEDHDRWVGISLKRVALLPLGGSQ
jgi:hypothetical protein